MIRSCNALRVFAARHAAIGPCGRLAVPGPQLIIDRENVYYLPAGAMAEWQTWRRATCDLNQLKRQVAK